MTTYTNLCASDFKGITSIVESLILSNIEVRKRFDPVSYSLIHYLNEFATIRLNGGRQLGHTTAIQQLASPWDIIFTYNHSHADMMKKSLQNVSCISYQSDFERLTRGVKVPIYRYIWIDCASFSNNLHLEKIYSTYGKDYRQTFILLG